ncbi:MAG: autotransporter-associated beta strand repeat-containing protein, partial [Planctomycetes bacterium]|nr:autotransporter-associated beta strand repeat-containing protein [Planctomycetota bacterium]
MHQVGFMFTTRTGSHPAGYRRPEPSHGSFATRMAIRTFLLCGLAICFALLLTGQARAQSAVLPDADLPSLINIGNNDLYLLDGATWNSRVDINDANRAALQIDGRGNTVSVDPADRMIGDFTVNNSIALTDINFVASRYQPVDQAYVLAFESANITSSVNLEGSSFTGFAQSWYRGGTVIHGYGAGSTITINGGDAGVTFTRNRGVGYSNNRYGSAGVVGVAATSITFNGNVTFDSNWSGNSSGAVMIDENGGSLTFNGKTRFVGNHAYGYGGAAFVDTGTLTFTGPVTFDGNYVKYSDNVNAYEIPIHATDMHIRGGALAVGYDASSTASVSFAQPATFSNNFAVSRGTQTYNRNAYGGAVSAYGSAQNLAFNGAAIFENNFVFSEHGTGFGGAIYYENSNNGQLVLNSGSAFTNNAASSLGGAIHMTGGTLDLRATSADIVFSGNRHGVSFDASDRPDLTTGTPNAVYFAADTTVQLSAGSGQTIAFNDPIAAAAGATLDVTKTGLGDVVFSGGSGDASRWDSAVSSMTTVSAGGFVLANGAQYGLKTGTGSFTVQNGAAVRGGGNAVLRSPSITIRTGGALSGTGGTFTLDSDNISLENNSNINGYGSINAASDLALSGLVTATVQTGQTLQLLRGMTGASGTLVKAGEGILELAAANTYMGATLIQAGTLSTSTAGAFASSGSVSVNPGAKLALNGYAQTARNLAGAGSIALGGAVLTVNNTFGTTFSGSISGTGKVIKQGSRDLTLSGNSTYSGGTTITEGRLISTTATALGTGAVSLGTGSILQLDHISNTIVNNSVNGTGSLEKTGSGTTALAGAGSSVTAVRVVNGGLSFQQTGAFRAGSYETASDATTTIASTATLGVSGQFTQLANSTLNVAIGASNTPIISAANAQISGTLNVTGFSATYPARASDLSANQHTIISATGFITGNFTNVSLGVGASPVNYLIASGYFNATRNRYYVGTQLRWNVGDNRASGTFDLPDAADQFELDVTLNIQTANPTLNWDGRSLTKEGAGTLLVSTVQGYTGNTIVNGGTLSLSAADALAINAGVTINSGATLALSGGRDQRLNQLSGSGTLNLGSSVATLNNTTAATAFSGSISGTGRV